MEVDICYKCVDFSKAHKEIINFNYDSHTMAPRYPKFNVGNGEGVVCHDCYAYLGTRIGESVRGAKRRIIYIYINIKQRH